MKDLKNIFLVFTAVLILLPSAVSFSHIFQEHSHKICDNYSEFHYHKESLDCDLHKFHKNPALNIDLPKYSFHHESLKERNVFEYYRFLNDYDPLGFDQRGPPLPA
ncbi:hypothetical protein [Gramella sp. KN1008]|uniref:hypothetical protein n=1 Tax=Gramella sp. KN1008 TaxID=2529298 RepID=UPI00103F24A1|nr:hypothetical protein [Gramella sp. KN1008]TBW29072.1 hypothetical protein EZJ28_04075 [Gramella sp. KN1008]